VTSPSKSALTVPLQCWISGERLSELYSPNYIDDLTRTGVASSPAVALARIEHSFGSKASLSGCNIFGIDWFREEIQKHPQVIYVRNALVITAPHTHWHSKNPTIISSAGRRYLIGPRNIHTNNRYLPVSFVFSASGPLAYEWADETITIDTKQASVALEAVQWLNERAWKSSWPLGIGLNFRFKDLFSPEIIPNLECQLEDLEDLDNPSEPLAEIHRTADYVATRHNPNVEQVAWGLTFSSSYNLSAGETAAICALRRHLSNFNDHISYSRELSRLSSLFIH
jgi:hypothetical protein